MRAIRVGRVEPAPSTKGALTEVGECKGHVGGWGLDGDDVREVLLHVENAIALQLPIWECRLGPGEVHHGVCDPTQAHVQWFARN
jgi:hypothetical protein